MKVGDRVRFLAEVMNRDGDIREVGQMARVTRLWAGLVDVEWRGYRPMRPDSGSMWGIPSQVLEVVEPV